MDEQGMRARIQQLIEHQHMNRQSFAEHIGVSPASLSQILNDKQKPTLAIVIAITNRFPALRYDWLLDGKEPMFTDGTTSDKNSPTPSQQEGATPPSSNPISAQSQPVGSASPHSHASSPGFSAPQYEVKYIDKPQRKITEIRIFYDDQTWESFVPKNSASGVSKGKNSSKWVAIIFYIFLTSKRRLFPSSHLLLAIATHFTPSSLAMSSRQHPDRADVAREILKNNLLVENQHLTGYSPLLGK